MASDIVLVGCGNMGFAMLSGWLSGTSQTTFHVVEPNEALRARAKASGAQVYEDAAALGDISPELVFLAVKPQIMGHVAPDYARFPNSVFVSIAAGVTIASLAGWLGKDVGLVRTMPNTPAAIGQGMLVSFANAAVPGTMKARVDDLLSKSGKTGWIEDESLMDAVTAVSGSGPAYVFHFIECLTEAAERLGLPSDLSRELALQTVAGAGALARQSDTTPDQLRVQVTSPGGTTAAALEVLMGQQGPLLDTATEAARDRGVELGKG